MLARREERREGERKGKGDTLESESRVLERGRERLEPESNLVGWGVGGSY